MLINQITPHLPKDNEEVNAHVKCLQVMLDAATVADPFHDKEDEDQGHEDDHRHSPCGESASSITPPEERGRGHDRDNYELRDVIRVAEMHAAGLKTGADIKRVMTRSSVMRGL
jgi:hypothetical protein